jgi:hypothetical protein
MRQNQGRWLMVAAGVLSLTWFPGAISAQQWTTPTADELSMTSIPQVPGAPAVILFREEKTDDSLYTTTFYTRLKVLTEGGKAYANVELSFDTSYMGTIVDGIEGRTIHPDGTVIPFSGEPYVKLLEKFGGVQVKSKVFTLPSVDVGSILEYRYKVHVDHQGLLAPDWYVQSELYTRKAHFMWRPTTSFVVTGKSGKITGRVAWTPILPPGAVVRQTKVDAVDQLQLDLDVQDVPPLLEEAHMPPVNSLSYRVMFFYSDYSSPTEYWTGEGKTWSKEVDKFVGPDGGVKEYVRTVVADGDSAEVKARKLYAAVMTFDNTKLTRQHTEREDRAEGFGDLKTSDDVLKRKRGTPRQLTGLFVAMARAAGLKAYVMGVADRDRRIWNTSFTDFRQMDTWIAIVEIGGKDVFFDPGQRYCEPEHLAWNHSLVGGLRQTDKGTALATTPGESWKSAKVLRIADLKLDDHGEANGLILMSWTGDPALYWRQAAVANDETELHEKMLRSMQSLLPANMQVKLTQVANLTDYDKPLKATFEAQGPIGSATGKRLLVPADLFEANAKATFPEAKREVPVDLHFAEQVQDVMRLRLPDSFVLESAPDDDVQQFASKARFEVKAMHDASSVTSYRTMMLGLPIFQPDEYDGLRGFYNKLDAKDQETIVLKRSAANAGAAANPGN